MSSTQYQQIYNRIHYLCLSLLLYPSHCAVFYCFIRNTIRVTRIFANYKYFEQQKKFQIKSFHCSFIRGCIFISFFTSASLRCYIIHTYTIWPLFSSANLLTQFPKRARIFNFFFFICLLESCCGPQNRHHHN